MDESSPKPAAGSGSVSVALKRPENQAASELYPFLNFRRKNHSNSMNYPEKN